MSDFVGIPSLFFCEFSLISNVSINLYVYVNKMICKADQSVKDLTHSIYLISSLVG